MAKWSEIRNNFFDEEEQCYCIDAWRTANDNEEGIILAKVYADHVVFLNKTAQNDAKVKDAILECQKQFVNL